MKAPECLHNIIKKPFSGPWAKFCKWLNGKQDPSARRKTLNKALMGELEKRRPPDGNMIRIRPVSPRFEHDLTEMSDYTGHIDDCFPAPDETGIKHLPTPEGGGSIRGLV